MKISIDNCEAYFLDYYEGNLSKERVEELFAFLILHPDMRELFDGYEDVSFSPDKKVHFDGIETLKKNVPAVDGINENNYEEYFVSIIEGLLSPEEVTEVEKYLLQYPEKREELELLKQAILIPDDSIVFENKAALHKSVLVTEKNFEEMAIAAVEGLLNAEEEKTFAASVASNIQFKKVYSLYQQTKVVADENIIFENKEDLKRKDRGAFWWMIDLRFAAAAAIVLLLGIFYWNSEGNQKIDKGSVALIDSTKPKVNPNINSNQSGNDQLANTDQNKNDADVNPAKINHPKQIVAFVHPENSSSNKIERSFAIPISNAVLSLNQSIYPSVDFSDTYYSGADYANGNSAPGRNSISVTQAAMRWMKNKLDRSSYDAQEDESVYASAYGNAPAQNGDVNGFDLTSSAVSALGHATGSNLRLGHQSKGTVLTIGKYNLILNRNK
ncbi:hypothetical protein BH09BAC5_BH09BAC5_07900 [soil metagenome]